MSGTIEKICVAFSFFFFLLYPVLSTQAGGQDRRKETMHLSLEEGLSMVLQNNLGIESGMITQKIETEVVKGEEGMFDPVISGSAQWADSTTPLSTRSSVAAGGRSSAESETYTVETGLSGTARYGTKYSIEFQDVRTRNSFNGFDAEYDSFAGIEISHPLLKDSGRDTTRHSIIIAEKNRDISLIDLKQLVIDSLSDYKLAYWDLVLSIEELKVKEESMKLATSLLDLNQKRLRAEVVSPLEVTQAEAGVASRKEDLIIAKGAVREKENALKRLISKDIFTIRQREIYPATTPMIEQVSIDLNRDYAEAITNRPDYERIKAEIDKSEISLRYTDNQELPEIDLEASYGYSGLGDSFNDSVSDLNNNPSWSLGLVARFPFGNSAARSERKIARLEARQHLLALKDLEQDILVEIDNRLRDIETNMQRIEVAKVSKRLAEESLKAEEIKLQEGLSTSHDVLEFQEELVEAKTREISAVIDYNKSLAELSRAKGTVLKEEGITISYDTISVERRDRDK